jgi:hypothetical protein
MEYIKLSGVVMGTFMCLYYINDVKNVKRYSGYQNTYKGLENHLTGVLNGMGIIALSLMI